MRYTLTDVAAEQPILQLQTHVKITVYRHGNVVSVPKHKEKATVAYSIIGRGKTHLKCIAH